MPLQILVIGSGVAGPALATLLLRSTTPPFITLLERAPALRTGGQQLDFKAQGTPIIRRMGLLERMRAHRVEEEGHEMVGARGECLASFGVKKGSGTEGSFGLTNEIEIMRGDIVKVLYEECVEQGKRAGERVKGSGVECVFGMTVREMSEDEGGVDVTFEDGKSKRFDLVIGADGQNSRTRKMVFGAEENAKAFRETGMQVAYYNIPKGPTDSSLAKIYIATYERSIMLRNSNRPTTQVYLLGKKNGDMIKETYKKSVAEQKQAWTETYKDAGWEVDRFLEGMKDTQDFYTHELVQVKLPSLYKGRVAFIGDAAYCPSFLTGMGTTSSLIGAYVLAGELARHGNDVHGALEKYNELMKVPTEMFQKLMPGATSLPSSPLLVWLLRTALWTMSTLRLDKLAQKLAPGRDKHGIESWPLPEYPELNLEE